MVKKANLLSSGLLLLIFVTIILVGQCFYFVTQINIIKQCSADNEAQTMLNIALAHKIKDEQTIYFNCGKVTRKKSKLNVVLKNNKLFIYDREDCLE